MVGEKERPSGEALELVVEPLHLVGLREGAELMGADHVVARLEAGANGQGLQELLDVPALLRRVLDEARTLSQGSHTFESQIQPGLFLLGGETEVLSIFSNLVSNAVRYTPPGGVIRVKWEMDGEQAKFDVADTGIGIAAKDIPRLTERFYRADVGRSRASGGTGLGLSIVKHALEAHQAMLHIESELGVGSTFSCHFPAERVRIQTLTLQSLPEGQK